MKARTPHTTPRDVRMALAHDEHIRALWNSLTPLARNEWICWIQSVKKQTTREKHIARMLGDLVRGKRRPCCWAGCTHR